LSNVRGASFTVKFLATRKESGKGSQTGVGAQLDRLLEENPKGKGIPSSFSFRSLDCEKLDGKEGPPDIIQGGKALLYETRRIDSKRD
jgi:hypothetical protein